MRNLMVAAVLIALCLYAPPAQACEECAEYFDYQSLHWCPYCRSSNCGYFSCEIRQIFGGPDYCTGDDQGCSRTKVPITAARTFSNHGFRRPSLWERHGGWCASACTPRHGPPGRDP